MEITAKASKFIRERGFQVIRLIDIMHRWEFSNID
jgi:hypothetical protein